MVIEEYLFQVVHLSALETVDFVFKYLNSVLWLQLMVIEGETFLLIIVQVHIFR